MDLLIAYWSKQSCNPYTYDYKTKYAEVDKEDSEIPEYFS